MGFPVSPSLSWEVRTTRILREVDIVGSDESIVVVEMAMGGVLEVIECSNEL